MFWGRGGCLSAGLARWRWVGGSTHLPSLLPSPTQCFIPLSLSFLPTLHRAQVGGGGWRGSRANRLAHGAKEKPGPSTSESKTGQAHNNFVGGKRDASSSPCHFFQKRGPPIFRPSASAFFSPSPRLETNMWARKEREESRKRERGGGDECLLPLSSPFPPPPSLSCLAPGFSSRGGSEPELRLETRRIFFLLP